jgi:hypothetical protein
MKYGDFTDKSFGCGQLVQEMVFSFQQTTYIPANVLITARPDMMA